MNESTLHHHHLSFKQLHLLVHKHQFIRHWRFDYIRLLAGAALLHMLLHRPLRLVRHAAVLASEGPSVIVVHAGHVAVQIVLVARLEVAHLAGMTRRLTADLAMLVGVAEEGKVATAPVAAVSQLSVLPTYVSVDRGRRIEDFVADLTGEDHLGIASGATIAARVEGTILVAVVAIGVPQRFQI